MAKATKLKGASLSQSMPKLTNDPATKSDDMENDYQTQGHLSTLLEAHKIINDPVKMQKVHKLAGRHKAGIKSIQDLKDLHQQKYGNSGSKQSTFAPMANDHDGDEPGE